MIKSVIIFLKIFLSLSAVFFLMEYPGKARFEWFSYQVEMPLWVMLLLALAFWMFFVSYKALKKIPAFVSSQLKKREEEKKSSNFWKRCDAFIKKDVVAFDQSTDTKALFMDLLLSKVRGDYESYDKIATLLCSFQESHAVGLGAQLFSKNLDNETFIEEKIASLMKEIAPTSGIIERMLWLYNHQNKKKPLFESLERWHAASILDKKQKRFLKAWFYALQADFDKDDQKLTNKIKSITAVYENVPLVLEICEELENAQKPSAARKILKKCLKESFHPLFVKKLAILEEPTHVLSRYVLAQELLSSKQESYESLSILASFALEAQLYTTVKQYFTKLQHYPLTQEALDLMSRYKTSSGDEEFVVPSPSGTLLNKDELKFTCPACLNTTQAFFFQCTSCAKIGTLCS